jgi:hypothetical protein
MNASQIVKPSSRLVANLAPLAELERHMPRCIYCLAEKPATDFNREHVIPEAFGGFAGALVLHRTVCEECNSYFSAALDLPLARRSSEGLERYAWGIRPAEEAQRFRYGDVIIQLNMPGSPWDGAWVRKEPTGEPGETTIEVLPQVAFRRRDGKGMKYYTDADAFKEKWRIDPEIDLTAGVRIYAPNAEAFQKLRDVLDGAGVSWTTESPVEAPTEDAALVRHTFTLPEWLKRAVAKIAFNYLAHSAPGVVFEPAFDPIRKYIRRGVRPFLPAVGVTHRSRLGIQAGEQIPVVHYLTLEPSDRGDVLVGSVSLFHWATYQVVLAFSLPAAVRDLKIGHVFNIADRRCYQLTRRSREDIAPPS